MIKGGGAQRGIVDRSWKTMVVCEKLVTKVTQLIELCPRHLPKALIPPGDQRAKPKCREQYPARRCGNYGTRFQSLVRIVCACLVKYSTSGTVFWRNGWVATAIRYVGDLWSSRQELPGRLSLHGNPQETGWGGV